jgi:hypothetical protein
MTDLPKSPPSRIKKFHESNNPFREVNQLFRNEIIGLINMLSDTSLSESIRLAIRKYLTITIFATLDFYFRNSARHLIDKNNLNVCSLFPAKSIQKLERLITENGTTKGNIVISTYRFVDLDEIDFVFSNLLNMNSFLDYLIKLNDIDQTRWVLDGHALPIDYQGMTKAYKLRNEIAHEVKEVKVSKSRVIALWDNFMNIMDIAQSVFLSISKPEHRETLDYEYNRGKKKAKNKAVYKLCADKIMSRLLEKRQLKQKYGRQAVVDEIYATSSDNILKENVNWVIERMLYQEIVATKEDVIDLTQNGVSRLKRTSGNDRDKWKREISEL